MPEPGTFKIKPYERHVFVCTGSKCAPDNSPAIYQTLKARLKALDLDQTKVRRAQVQCLGICAEGPIVLVYPEGTWYLNVTPEKLDQIIEEHLVKGRPITEWATPIRSA